MLLLLLLLLLSLLSLLLLLILLSLIAAIVGVAVVVVVVVVAKRKKIGEIGDHHLIASDGPQTQESQSRYDEVHDTPRSENRLSGGVSHHCVTCVGAHEAAPRICLWCTGPTPCTPNDVCFCQQ
jgi:hypothetical protein